MLVTTRQWLQFAVSLLLGSLILYWVFKGQDWDEMLHTLKRARFGWIGLSSLAGLLAHALRGYRWTLLAGAVGPKPATVDAYHSVMVGYLANLALPRVGEVARCGALSRKSGLPMNSLIGTVIVERAVDVLVLLLVVVMTLLLYSSLLLGPAQRLLMRLGGGSTLWVLVLTGLGFGLMAYLLWRNRRLWLERLSGGEKGRKFLGLLRGLWLGLRSIRSLSHPGRFLLSTFGIWLGYFLMSYFCLFAFESTQALGVSEAFLVLVAGSLGFLMPVQGGIGAYHAAVSKALLMLPATGISPSEALSYATLTHAAQTLLFVVGGFISFLILAAARNKNTTS